MAKRKKKIGYKKERVVMSDILPYEVPIPFSNRHFYKFLVNNKIEFSNGKLLWKKDTPIFNKIIEFIFNIKITATNLSEINGVYRFKISNNYKPYKLKFFETVPFSFKISHKKNEFRELSVIHPSNQLSIIEFYEKYKELIIYYCSVSKYSIRKPHKVARYTYFNDAKHHQINVPKPERDLIEIFGKEYENLKTFFVYKKYPNIHKFFESYTYQRNEKKFNKLFKFDISKCFDSIYTHSLSWALANKEIVKENVMLNDYSFGGAFDSLMQKLNYNETNGILIGPEFSRIFAEILLQHIDLSVFNQLKNKGVRNKVDYSIFRYVDDYFLFYNEESVKELIHDAFKFELKKYKLYISESKSITYEKPIITELTIAKERVSHLLNNLFELKETKIEKIEGDEIKEIFRYTLFFNGRKSIVDFKTIVKETKIEYKDILNYTFAIIDRRVFTLINKYEKAKFENTKAEEKFKLIFISNLVELIDFIMFIYSVSPRINTTIKLCITLSKIVKFLKLKHEKITNEKYFTGDLKDQVFKKMFDDISLVLEKNSYSENKQIESLYLLIVLQELGKDYRLHIKTLIKYLKIKETEIGDYKFPFMLNYWTIMIILFYIKNIKRYDKLRIELIKHILKKYEGIDKKQVSKYSELVFLTLDSLTCPYIDNSDKRKILELCGVVNFKQDFIDKIIAQETFFIKWRGFDFEKELNTKRSQEVY